MTILGISKLALQFSATSNPHIASTLVGVNNITQLEECVKWLEDPIDETLLQEVLQIMEPIKNHKRIEGLVENN